MRCVPREFFVFAGIIESPAGQIALCVLSAEHEDPRWTLENAGDRLCAEVARTAFFYFNPDLEASAPTPPGK